MTITITHDTTIGAIKKQFQQLFPWLKIECFNTNSPGRYGGALADHQRIWNMPPDIYSRELKLLPEQTSTELEQLFLTALGIRVEVYRRERNAWVEVRGSDCYTLHQENELAKAYSELSPPCAALLNAHETF
jgi:hypothetical protein